MAAAVRKLCLRALIFLIWASVRFMKGASINPCNDTSSIDASSYSCNPNGPQNQCTTFVLLHATSYFPSLSNLSFYLGLNRTGVAEASGLPMDTEQLQQNQPLLIPRDCRCNGSYFQAEVMKTAIEGESISGIAASFEGLTTCKAIHEKNPNLPSGGLDDEVQLLVPLICACPTSFQLNQGIEFLISYPIFEGDTVSSLASVFNTSVEAIVSVNNRTGTLVTKSLLHTVPPLFIPVAEKPDLALLSKAHQSNSSLVDDSIPVMAVAKKSHSRRLRACKIGIYTALSGVALVLSIAAVAAVLVIRMKKKPGLCKTRDVELQQLNVKNARELKDELEEPQDTMNDQSLQQTPHQAGMDTYTLEELRRATEDFSLSNLIEDSMFHGRLNGKNLAIKRTNAETVSKIEFELFDGTHRHLNVVRLLGACAGDACDSYLVFEYAKNGSLKDWLHGGLAMKSQFIASCYCFLTWNQRLRICLQVAMGLHYMHHTMNPSYVHGNIKSRNILLDEEFNAKIGSFGMRRCSKDEFEDPLLLSTSPAGWSRGYLAPEYFEQGSMSPSNDIFAFGVILLEVLSGKTPINRANIKGESVLLSKQIKTILQSDGTEELRGWMDCAIGEAYSFEAALTLAKLARACVEDDPSLRPTAEEVFEKLARMVEELPGEQISICESSSKSQFK
ncbi:protein LYK2-like [Magnolia sinica]|uniref:protein LYK2-like n=1 Tax=Magnolia sinica TaxID=86752 RepID=UPI002659BBB8|nr:protein LYK2-like [Magnolia sinica]